MRRAAVAATLVLLLAGACGGGDEEDPVVLQPPNEQGLVLGVRHTQPLRARSPVTWTLEVRNGGAAPVTLTFSSGQRGDVVLYKDGAERYRWSEGKVFAEMFSETPIANGGAEVIELRDQALNVEPGQYELVAVLTSGPAPNEARQPVTVSA